MVYFVVTFILSIGVVLLILSTNRYHAHLSFDHDLVGVQKFHKIPTPRIGGVAIYISFAVISIIMYFAKPGNSYVVGLVLSSLLVFLIGLLEDVVKRVSPSSRLICFIIGTLIAIYFTHNIPIIYQADFVVFNHILAQYKIVGILLTLLGVVGLTNAYNIIDGYNGLSAITAMINLATLCILSYLLSDINVMNVSLCLIAAIFGFFIFNYPRGRIFLGDGGAYLLGFSIAVISVYLVQAHVGLISPYAVLLVNIYPITEIAFSIYRKKYLRSMSAMVPDGLHLHMLIYHRCIKKENNNLSRNSKVMPLMLYFIVPQTVLTLFFYKSTVMCLFFITMYILFYIICYFCLLKFKTFYFLKIMLKRNQRLHKN